MFENNESMIKVDFDSVAETMVRECMRVSPGEAILVSGGAGCLELLENLAVAIAKERAYHLLLVYTDRLQKRLLLETEISFLGTPSRLLRRIVNFIDGRIVIDSSQDPRTLQEVPEGRIGAQRRAGMPLNDTLRKRKVRWIGMGYPTREKAEIFGIDYEMFHDMFWKGVTIDYKKLHEQGKKLAETIRNARVRIRTEKTDLEFSLKERPVLIDDGIISEEDMQMDDVGSNLPAGEVFCSPVENSVEGEAFFEEAFYKGEKITGIHCVFERGKLKRVSCEKNEHLFKEVLANAQGDKDVVGEFGIGLNPEIDKVTGYVLTDEKIIGSIHIALGENREFGGRNESSLHWDLVMMHPTVEVDGEMIMEEGKVIV